MAFKIFSIRKGGVILSGGTDGKEKMVYVTIDSGVVKLGRTSNIDSSGENLKATRSLIFEESS